MREIKDYLHLYLGCDLFQEGGYPIKLTGSDCDYIVNHNHEYGKPILRPLSDMTEEEQDFRWNNFINIRVINQEVVAEEIRWLLSKRFDLFNLIPEGLAIDKTKLNSEPKDQRSVARDDK